MNRTLNIIEQKKPSHFAKLPDQIQSEIKQLLMSNDFRAAKALYDQCLLNKNQVNSD